MTFFYGYKMLSTEYDTAIATMILQEMLLPGLSLHRTGPLKKSVMYQ